MNAGIIGLNLGSVKSGIIWPDLVTRCLKVAMGELDTNFSLSGKRSKLSVWI